MRRVFIVFSAFWVSFVSAEQQLEPREIAAIAREAVVTVTVLQDGEASGQGSGFVLQADGIIVTNLHVVSGASSLSIKLASGEIYDNVYVLGHDARRDVAVLKIPAVGLASLVVGNDREVEIGDSVYVMGSPLGLSGTFSDGLLSAKRTEDGSIRLQISAPLSEGSSGGPVLNSSGEVIGIATSFFSRGQNLNIAMPARYAEGLVSVAGTPVPFADSSLAEIPSSNSPNPYDIVWEWPEIMAMLPSEMRQELGVLTPWRQQVAARNLLIATDLETDGWKEWSEFGWGFLGRGDVDSQMAFFPAGNYHAYGICDDDCTDLDLAVRNADGSLLIEDAAIDAFPVLDFTISEAGNYFLNTGMYSCEITACFYVASVWREAHNPSDTQGP